MSIHSLSYPPKHIINEPIPIIEKPRHVLVYFIPGNPGLIDYYAPFLSHLRELLDATPSSSSTARFHIYGQDLAGFSDDDGHEPFTPQRKPHNLEYQIQLALKTVQSMRVDVDVDGPRKGDRYDDVLLMGHSVGAYIALQLCHRTLLSPRAPAEADLASESTTRPSLRPTGSRLEKGILLFPTIVHIARSPSGRRLDALRRAPVLGPNVHRLARFFLWLWPRAALYWFVRAVMGFPAHAAGATTRWLRSRDGVWQALHMAMDEMQVIGEDTWDEELWDIEREAEAQAEVQQQQQESKQQQQQQQQQVAATPAPKFYFFFGRNDHWVANHYRDIFIERRSKQPERTRLIIDEEGSLPHAFCVRHSETVAEKVCTWIQEMYGS